MKLRLIPFAFALIAAGSVHAQSFQFQTDADYAHLSSQGVDVDAVSIKQQYFLQSLQTNDTQPWKEAAFLSRTSSVYMDYSRLTMDIPGMDNGSLSGWGIGGEYMSRDHDFYAALQSRFMNGSNSYLTVGKAGFFVQPNWLVNLDVYHSDAEGEGSSTDYGVSTKLVLPVMQGDHLVLQASYADFDEDSGYSIGADYYIRPYWSVGMTYRNDMPDADLALDAANLVGDSTEIRTEYYVMPQLALRANFNRVDFDGEHENQYGAGISYRF